MVNMFVCRYRVGLTGGISLSSSSTTLRVLLSATNLNHIKALPFCTTNSNCFLTYSRDGIQDMVGLHLIERLNGAALLVLLISDTNRPSLVSFDEINFQNNTITLALDESINILSVNFTSLILQCLFENPISRIQLLSAGIVRQTISTLIFLNLNIQDVDRIKIDPFVCNYRGDCYIQLLSTFIKDINGNSIMEVAHIQFKFFK